MGIISGKLTFFAAGLALLMAIEQLIGPQRSRSNYLAASVLGADALCITGTGMAAAGYTLQYPILTLLVVTGIFAIGPLHYFYYCSLLFPQKSLHRFPVLHFLPAAAALLVEMTFHVQPVEVRKEIVGEVFAKGSFHPLKIVIILGSIMILIYMYRVFREVIALRHHLETRTAARVVMVANCAAVTGIICLSSGLVAAVNWLLHLGNLLVSFLFFGIFLAHRRYPEFFQILKREIRARHYHNSMLGGIDIEVLSQQVTAFMEEEKLFRESDLTLRKLADHLALTPHQLSEFLNNRLSMSFSRFINSFRVKEAREILIAEPKRGILSIGYHVGFNSKSSFNTVFKKETGMTPLQYRNKKLPSQ